MKNFFYLLAVLFTSLIVSCSDDDPIPAPVVVTPEVVIPDTGAPTITLVGSSTINIEEGDSYTDAGASASDEVDGDISSSITTSGSVDASTPGTYTLTYSVSDAAGNSVELTRTIIVAVATKITALAATGRVSEQTPEQARSTINGKWNFPESSAKSSYSSKLNTCEFDFIEFTDTTYFLAINLEGEFIAVSGPYELNEDSEGNVSSVDLYYYTGEVDLVIATLTDINVIEINDEIEASFTVNLTIPDTADFDSCNELSGTYSDVGKEEPMQQSYAVANTSTSSDSTSDTGSDTFVSYIDPITHVTLINNTWSLQTVTEDGVTGTVAEVLEDFCYDEECPDDGVGDCIEFTIEGCSPPTFAGVQFSAYGSYNLVFSGGTFPTEVEVGTWVWIDEPGPPRFYRIDGEYEDDNEIMTILELSDSKLTLEGGDGDILYFNAL